MNKKAIFFVSLLSLALIFMGFLVAPAKADDLEDNKNCYFIINEAGETEWYCESDTNNTNGGIGCGYRCD